MEKHSKEEINTAFEIINNEVYQKLAEKALQGNIAAIKLMHEIQADLELNQLRKELLGV